MPTVAPAEHRKPWEEHSVAVALALAVLVPGAGHLYQGRLVKGLIYLFGILGLFLWGVKLGDGVVVYNLPDKANSSRITLHYAAQLCAGAVSYPALWQSRRVNRDDNRALQQLDQPMTASFSGRLQPSEDDAASDKLEGTVSFSPVQGEFGTDTKGTFKGTLDRHPVELKLAGDFSLDRPIGPGFRRTLKCGVVGEKDSIPPSGKMIIGSIPRSIMNGYGVPPNPDQLQNVTGRLGKLHELALVFTWIAGLLNILAIWDCVQGPAYGFGDEPQSSLGSEEKASEENEAPVNPASAAPQNNPVSSV